MIFTNSFQTLFIFSTIKQIYVHLRPLFESFWHFFFFVQQRNLITHRQVFAQADTRANMTEIVRQINALRTSSLVEICFSLSTMFAIRIVLRRTTQRATTATCIGVSCLFLLQFCFESIDCDFPSGSQQSDSVANWEWFRRCRDWLKFYTLCKTIVCLGILNECEKSVVWAITIQLVF